MDSFKDGRVAAGILAAVSALTLTTTVLRRHALASSKDSKTSSAGPGTSIIVFRCTRAVATLALCALSYYTTAALEVTELGHWALAAAIVRPMACS
jgi:cytochrome c-type biogenesis protein CcmH/NrfG